MGKIIENLVLTEIHSAGKAVGQHNGKNIFVDFGIPGETVEVSLDRRQRGFYCASIEKIKIPSATIPKFMKVATGNRWTTWSNYA